MSDLIQHLLFEPGTLDSIGHQKQVLVFTFITLNVRMVRGLG